MKKVHLVIEVLKAEKEEEGKRRKVQTIVQGFDAKTSIRTNFEIKGGRNPSQRYRKIKTAPQVREIHRHAERPILYENNNRFLTQREWGESTTKKA